ncbi:hypothetical protein GCM10022261_03350 [Brevibacterium daeguense]|uniref:TRAP-type C4-dicarboxylate transport system substrate-binding protein n=1 Tax=Brevibacterium daeguense TaxID=909936 RepID=A0ABP8EFP9_9MICO|nr:C4-dicarboxylate ABC transporter substrate-binding protein [Brevibacterium daeguense]
MTRAHHLRSPRTWLTAPLAVGTALVVTACGGSVGATGGNSGAGDTAGFDYGASQEDVDAAIADLDPVELVFQASSASPESVVAKSNTAFIEAVEERSGGKIKLDVVWGQAIAGYAEVDDALADGRVDISYTQPMYDPSHYTAYDSLIAVSGGLPQSPMAGELISNSVISDIAFQSETMKSEFEDRGLTRLLPSTANNGYYSLCTEPGTELADYDGRQVRIGASAHGELAQDLGASPVSLEYVETFEALQRNTLDCTFTPFNASIQGKFHDVAPHIGYATDQGLPRGWGAYAAGTKFQSLPLPYQQIVFDSLYQVVEQGLALAVDTNAMVIEEAKAKGGEVAEFGPEAKDVIATSNEDLMQQVVESGTLGDDLEGRMAASLEKWTGVVEELEYVDGGETSEMDEWYTEGEVDFAPISQRLFEDVVVPHRPGA